MTIRRGTRGGAVTLSALAAGLREWRAVGEIGSTPIRGIRSDSAQVRQGEVFIALSGASADGHDFLQEAIRRGAAAIVVERPPLEPLPLPVIQVPDSHAALAELAACWHGYPARDLRLVGITGTVGKTSVLSILEAILGQAGLRPGTIGSLGVRIGGETIEETGFTAPDPLVLHEKLALLRDAGCDMVVMEVTSHALDQKRVHGLTFDLGIFTNLLPLEHLDYHGSFAAYVETKTRFFGQLKPRAGIVHSGDDPVVAELLRERELAGISCGRGPQNDLCIEELSCTPKGTRLVLRSAGGLSLLAGGRTPPLEIPLRLRMLGRTNVQNAALAATAALVLSVPVGSVRRSLARIPPARRRMEIIHSKEIDILDDTVGHPESIGALFETVESLGHRRVHAVFAIRGSRGPEINEQEAQSLAIWAGRVRFSTLLVTCSSDSADPRNRVEASERSAFLEPLDAAGVTYEIRDRLDEAIVHVLTRTEKGDLVLLLGAQGMDEGRAIAAKWLDSALPRGRPSNMNNPLGKALEGGRRGAAGPA